MKLKRQAKRASLDHQIKQAAERLSIAGPFKKCQAGGRVHCLQDPDTKQLYDNPETIAAHTFNFYRNLFGDDAIFADEVDELVQKKWKWSSLQGLGTVDGGSPRRCRN